MQASKLRKIVLAYYLLMPYSALVAVAFSGSSSLGILILTGWICTIIYQLFLLVVNQDPELKAKPLYKHSQSLIIPLVATANQFCNHSSVKIFS